MRKRFPFGAVFGAGLAAGIIMMNLGKSILLDRTGLLAEDTLYLMRDMTVDSSALFVYVLRKRFCSLAVLAVMATTYLGLIFCAGAAFCYGAAAGVFVTAGILRYGARGILLALAGTLPQYLAYLPAFYALLLWCEEIYRSIYQNKNQENGTKTPALVRRVFHLLLICAAVLLGCVLESFANPQILLSFLHTL